MGKEYNVTITIVSKLTLCVEAESQQEAENGTVNMVTVNRPTIDFDPENIVMVTAEEVPDGD